MITCKLASNGLKIQSIRHLQLYAFGLGKPIFEFGKI